MDEQRQSLIDRIKQAQNILVTVSANPSVDQLSAAIGLTIALNKLDKHGTAVFSGQPPSTIEFLKPENTLEKNTDSLRDFIIALDKSKADKLRYKVEDQVVRIFITPYKTSLSQNDLDFSQGDFNVDVVVALGVTEQQDLDQAIVSHGRILHDATVVSVSAQGQGSLGTINWVDPSASSLSEMVVGLVDGLDKKVMDGQIATALLTGIVATTDRFRNDKTSPKTMSASAELMAAGANQQLIASELDAPAQTQAQPGKPGDSQADGAQPAEADKPDPGTLEIDHEARAEATAQEPAPEDRQPQVHVDENGQLVTEGGESLPEISRVRGVGPEGEVTENNPENYHERMVEPPAMGDPSLTANSSPEAYDPATEELTLPAISGQTLTHNESVLPPSSVAPEPVPEQPHYDVPAAPTPPVPEPPAPPVSFTPPAPEPPAPAQPPPPAPEPFLPPTPAPDPFTLSAQPAQPVSPASSIDPNATLTEIEESVDSPHVHASTAASIDTVDDARSAVEAALNAPGVDNPLQPIAALNAQPLGSELHDAAAPAAPVAAVPNTGFSEPTPGNTPADATLDMPLPSSPFGPGLSGSPAGQPGQATQAPTPNPPTAPAPPASTPPAPPSALPGTPQTPGASTTPPPPVPPPMLPPVQ